MASPELPYLGAGIVTVIGATMRDGHLPSLGRVAMGTIALVIVASATNNTRIAPLVAAFGYLVLLVAVMAAVRATYSKVKK